MTRLFPVSSAGGVDIGGKGPDRRGNASAGMSVSLVARQHGIDGSQVFDWCRPMNQGVLTVAAAGEEVVPASEYRALEVPVQVRELQRLLGKKAMEIKLARRAVSRAAGPKAATEVDLIFRD